MDLPLLDPFRDLLRARAVAAGFLVSAGLVALTRVISFPAAALVFTAPFAVLALAAYYLGRMIWERQASNRVAARTRAEADIALATAMARSTRPLLPIAAFLAAFALTWRP